VWSPKSGFGRYIVHLSAFTIDPAARFPPGVGPTGSVRPPALCRGRVPFWKVGPGVGKYGGLPNAGDWMTMRFQEQNITAEK
jgi:hypothetical protein